MEPPQEKPMRSEEETAAHHDREIFALDVLMGLSSSPKQISSKYFYDAEGSRLFERIMRLPEYYPTACEQEIFTTQSDRLARAFGKERLNLVELGSGDGLKTKVLLDSLLRAKVPFRYLPIDISASAIEKLTASLRKEFPTLETQGLVADYFIALRTLSRTRESRNVVLFLGSNIGNFSRAESRVFLHNLWNALNDGDLVLTGFDLKKDIDIMLRAYNDAQGVTREFNLNLLRRINRELGGNFEVEKFRFFSTYDVFGGSINSYLVSQTRQTVYIGVIGQGFEFRPWEPIRTEFSYKYLDEDIDRLARQTGFTIVEQFHDSKRWFVDSLWRVTKGNGH